MGSHSISPDADFSLNNRVVMVITYRASGEVTADDITPFLEASLEKLPDFYARISLCQSDQTPGNSSDLDPEIWCQTAEDYLTSVANR